MQIARRLVPAPAIDQIVPIGNLVVDRTAGRRAGDLRDAVTIGYAAIHAARGLAAQLLLRQRQDELVPVLDALFDRLVVAVFTLDFEKAGDLTHRLLGGLHRGGLLLGHLRERAAIFDRHDLLEQPAIAFP